MTMKPTVSRSDQDSHRFSRVIADVWFRNGSSSVDAAYGKGLIRIYPSEWTPLELRAIADHMERMTPHPKEA